MIAQALPELSVAFENEDYKPRLDSPFAIFQLGTVTTSRLAQGKCSQLQYTGDPTLTVKVGIKRGAEVAYSYADRVIAYIMEHGSEYGFKFIDTPYVTDSLSEGDWFSVPIIIPFIKES